METKHAPAAAPEVCPIARCIEEQRKAAEFIRDNPDAPADQLEGAWRGLCDWAMEETILRLEEKKG